MATEGVLNDRPDTFAATSGVFTHCGNILPIGIEAHAFEPSGYLTIADDMAAGAAAVLRLARLRGENDEDPAGTLDAALAAADVLLQLSRIVSATACTHSLKK
ncbi:hypothetical protein E2F46_06130 [Luteimonas aestuarii]|uniref:Uncharacterized protein n=1 Tax=Luteimonas aestuarii TaxID=453837 RepID=A0A4V6PLQ2_9GAMM|nr:hypothetical protein [Luteimonas aestuarii]TDK26172.1 hypothetical protein E2F46_06130 [Luteimonas aestuarii]